MKHLVLSLALAMTLPITVGGCDKLKELTGDKSSAKKDSSDDEDEDDDDKKKKKKNDKGDDKSARAPSSGAPSTPASPAGGSASSAHMPADCEAVITVNLSKLMQNPAMTKEIVPLLEEMIASPNPKQASTKKVQAFMKEAGLTLQSIHNGAMCVKNIGPAKNQEQWVFAFGGAIKPDSIIPALEKSGVLEAADKVIDVDGRKALAAKEGALGQFPDGVLGLSSNIDMYKAATATSAATTSVYRIDPSHELAFALSDAFVQKKVKEDTKAPEPMKAIKSVSGYVDR